VRGGFTAPVDPFLLRLEGFDGNRTRKDSTIEELKKE
jgi:hypothetical protein